jgi:cation transport ATPase
MRSVLSEDDIDLLKMRAGTLEITREAKEQKPDDYTSQIGKNIPVEVVSFYTGVFALVNANVTDPAVTTVSYVMFVIALFGTILYSWLKNTKDEVPNVAIKVGMATIAFVLWAYTIWWPLKTYIPQNAFVGGALVLAYLFASPAVYESITLIQKRNLRKNPPAAPNASKTPPPKN